MPCEIVLQPKYRSFRPTANKFSNIVQVIKKRHATAEENRNLRIFSPNDFKRIDMIKSATALDPSTFPHQNGKLGANRKELISAKNRTDRRL